MGGQVAEWFSRIAHEHAGFEVHVVDLAALNLPLLDEPEAAVEGQPYQHEHTRQWSALTTAADAFAFVMPEYNQGYTAPLKNALDYLYSEWNDKPVAFVSYGMSSGGMRAATLLRPVVSALKMIPVADSVVIHLRQACDAEGRLTPTAAMGKAAQTTLDELLRLTTALAPLRG